MHVDAFFEYLIDHPHPYWTQIPSDSNPVCDSGRDGVAAEDDMALRALLPHIRPKRGRKRPEDDDLSKSPSQKPRVDSPPGSEEFGTIRSGLGPWSAHPDSRGAFGLSAPDSARPVSAVTGTWPLNDSLQTPLTAYPHSAITPSTRTHFWADSAEPRSAITPPKPKSLNRRHGAKVVSSAWRPGSSSTTGKTRGRPPINRPSGESSAETPTFKIHIESISTPIQQNPDPSPLSFAPPPPQTPSQSKPPSQSKSESQPQSQSQTQQQPTPSQQAPNPHSSQLPSPSSQSQFQPQFQSTSQISRPAKPSISLKVPERPGGAIRLATPPRTTPVVAKAQSQMNGILLPGTRKDSTTCLPGEESSGQFFDDSLPPEEWNDIPPGFFDNMEDKVNVDAVMAFFAREILAGDWFDHENKSIPPGNVEEASAMVRTTLENLYRSTPTKEAFLVNLAALVGGNMLMTTSRLKITRVSEGEESTKYRCDWEYRLGNIRGNYSMAQSVRHDRWKKTAPPPQAENESNNTEFGAEYWQKKYESLFDQLKQKEQQLGDMKRTMVECLRDLQPNDK
jgi:hypothetical protein